MVLLMIFAGFGYKISSVPFHFWTPDVYEGSPSTITAYLSVAPKAAGFAMIIRFFHQVFSDSIGLTSNAFDPQIYRGLKLLCSSCCVNDDGEFSCHPTKKYQTYASRILAQSMQVV